MSDKLEQVAKVANVAATDMCSRALDSFGVGKEYRCFVGAAASTLLFHLYRISYRIEFFPKGEDVPIEVLQALLDDVAHNIEKSGGQKIAFKVEKR